MESDVVIDLGGGRTAPMTPPPELGAAFAAVVAEALSWDAARRADVQQRFDAAIGDVDTYLGAVERIQEAAAHAGLEWSCQFGEPGHHAEAFPYIDTLESSGMYGAAAVAAAVLARDLGLTTEPDFTAVTTPWTAVGLPLPEARPSGRLAADQAEVEQQARRLDVSRYGIDGWPIAAAAIDEDGDTDA